MNIGQNARENVLVTKGNYTMLAAGTPIWTVTAGVPAFNVPEGQFFAVNRRTGLAVDATNVATTIDPIRIGVSLGTGPRWLSGEDFYPRYIRAIRAKSPVCGTVDVTDLWWKCTECYEDYAVMLSVRDNDTMSYSSAHTDFENYVANARPNCNACPEECSPEATCDVVADALVAELNTLLNENDIKAYVTRLRANTYTYCFKVPRDGRGECGEDCAEYSGIAVAEFVLDGVTNTVSYTSSTVPATMAELSVLLQALADAITSDEDFDGSAYVTYGAGAECCVQLHINTDATVNLEHADAAYTPCTTDTPQADHPDMCGIRAIATPIRENAGCILAAPLAFYSREINLYPSSGSFKDAIVEKQTVRQFPQNFGHQVQMHEYTQEQGGQGRKYRATNTRLTDGIGYNADPKSRINNAITFADREKSYVSFHIEHAIPHSDYVFRGTFNPLPVRSTIYVPECELTACSIREFLVELASISHILFDIGDCEEVGGTGGTQ